jgi:hypothetical protein
MANRGHVSFLFLTPYSLTPLPVSRNEQRETDNE